MKLSIIIVNYNTGALTKALVESLLTQKLPDQTEIIVVDNDSKDESVSFLRSDFPEIVVIENEKNVGLAAGVNTGIAHASGEYYLVLNPDMIAFDGAPLLLTQFMDENPNVGMSGGKLVSPNGKLQYSCYRFYRPITILYRRTWLGKTNAGKREVARFLMKDFNHAAVRDVDWLMGACLMVRSEIVQQIGGMDEQFFLYFEDVDWCRRVWEAGYRVTYVPDAKFSHYYQQSSKRGSIFTFFVNKAARAHIVSAFKYFWKYWGKPHPHKEAPLQA